MSAKSNSESKVNTVSEWHANLNDSNLCVDQLEMVQRRAARFAYSSVRYSQRLRLGTTSNPQTPWQVEHLFFSITRGPRARGTLRWTPSGVPSSTTSPAGSSRSFPAIPASSAVCRCLQVRLLSKNLPGLECFPSGANGGEAPSHWRRPSCICSHSSNITTSCVKYSTNCFLFLHLFLFEFIYALLPLSFCHRCSLWQYVARHHHLLNQNMQVADVNNKKVSYRKQIAHQHLRWTFLASSFDHHAKFGCCFGSHIRDPKNSEDVAAGGADP